MIWITVLVERYDIYKLTIVNFNFISQPIDLQRSENISTVMEILHARLFTVSFIFVNMIKLQWRQYYGNTKQGNIHGQIWILTV